MCCLVFSAWVVFVGGFVASRGERGVLLRPERELAPGGS